MSAKTIADRERFIANVGASTFRPRDDLHMLCVAVNAEDGTFDPVWLVPSVDLWRSKKPGAKRRYQFSASMKPGTKDQWSPYRSKRADLPARILAILDSLA